MKTRSLIALTMLIVLGVGGALSDETGDSAFAADALPTIERVRVCQEVSTAGGGLNRAGVVVVFPNGTDTYCVSFEESEISGAELLERTGLPLVLSGFGGLGAGVCRIDDVGCSDPNDCFCQCRGADCMYWTYFELDAGEWDFLNVGASQRTVRDGDIDGWVWGNGRTPPGATALDAVCPAVQPTAIPTATQRPVSSGTAQRSTSTPRPPNVDPTQIGRNVAAPLATATPKTVTPQPTVTFIPTQPVARVVRQSSRPTSELARAESAVTDGEDSGGLPPGLLAFGAIGLGLIAVSAVVAVRRRQSE